MGLNHWLSNRSMRNPAAELCLATGAAALGVSGVSFVVSRSFGVWDVAGGMLAVAGFYLTLGAVYAFTEKRTPTASAAQTSHTIEAPAPVMVRPARKTQAAREDREKSLVGSGY